MKAPRIVVRIIDPFVVALVAAIVFASLFPAHGSGVEFVRRVATSGIVLLFFLHGAKLPREAVIAGARNWKLHSAILGTSFVVFPMAGFILMQSRLLNPALNTGFLFLTLLPSTVQSSIAFTATAGGDVAAAVCAAAFSNLLGIVATPILTTLMLQRSATASSWSTAQDIFELLLLPFLIGHLSRPLTAVFIARHKGPTTFVDRGSILLVVYSAFSSAVVDGLWTKLALGDFLLLGLFCAILLGVVLSWTRVLAGKLGLPREQMIVLQFSGSKKSLASGVPMAGALFAPAQLGLVVLPLMLFHQIQLFVCALLAARYGRERPNEIDPDESKIAGSTAVAPSIAGMPTVSAASCLPVTAPSSEGFPEIQSNAASLGSSIPPSDLANVAAAVAQLAQHEALLRDFFERKAAST